MTRRLTILVRAGGVSVALMACQFVAGIDRVEKLDGRGDAGTGETGADGAVDPCHHAVPPPEPAVDEDGDTELPPFYLAFRNVDVVAKAGDTYGGFDLDGVCTCDDRPGTAAKGTPSCTPRLRQCDLDGGIDNRAAFLIEQFAPAGFSPSRSMNEGIAEGKRGILLYIKGYNGKKNDRRVTVGAMISHGIFDGTGCGSATGFMRSPPGWCGKDLWSYPVQHVKPTTKEPLFQGNAYVNDGVLVFRSDMPMTMFFGRSLMTFGSPIAVGRIEKTQAGLWKLQGMLAGRIPVTELLAATGASTDPTDGDAGLCTSPFFVTVKKTLCEAVDIRKTDAFDFKDGACDAVSSAMSFTAEQASVGEEQTSPTADNGCAREKVAPDVYTCP